MTMRLRFGVFDLTTHIPLEVECPHGLAERSRRVSVAPSSVLGRPRSVPCRTQPKCNVPSSSSTRLAHSNTTTCFESYRPMQRLLVLARRLLAMSHRSRGTPSRSSDHARHVTTGLERA